MTFSRLSDASKIGYHPPSIEGYISSKVDNRLGQGKGGQLITYLLFQNQSCVKKKHSMTADCTKIVRRFRGGYTQNIMCSRANSYGWV